MLVVRRKNLKKLSKQVIRNVPEKDVKELEEYFNTPATKAVLRVVVEYLEQEIASNITSSEKKGKYEVAGWSLSHADDIGYRRGLHKVITILNGNDHA